MRKRLEKLGLQNTVCCQYTVSVTDGEPRFIELPVELNRIIECCGWLLVRSS